MGQEFYLERGVNSISFQRKGDMKSIANIFNETAFLSFLFWHRI